MAAGYVVKTGTTATALSAATAKTLVNLIAASTKTAVLVEASVSFDGVTASAVPVLFELCLSTQATAGTPGASPTRQQTRGKGTAVCTAGVDYSAEPTALTPFKHWLLAPHGGLMTVLAAPGRGGAF